MTVRRVGAMDDLSCIDEQIDSIERANRVLSESPVGRGSPDLTLNRGQYTAGSPTTPDVRLWHRAVVVHQVWGGGGGGGGLSLCWILIRCASSWSCGCACFRVTWPGLTWPVASPSPRRTHFVGLSDNCQ